MKLGTVVYNSQIYNLDCMTNEELKNLLNTIESDKKENFNKAKDIVNKAK